MTFRLLSPGGLLACVTRLRAEGDQPRASAATRLLLEAYGRAPRSLAAAISLQQLLAAAGSNARQAAEAVADLATLAAAAGGAAAQLDAVATTGGGSAMQRQVSAPDPTSSMP